MLEKDILIGGEESGSIGIGRHLPERDGLLNALLLANVMAEEGRTLGSLVSGLQEEYGEHHYGRLDLHIPEETKQAAIRRAAAGVSEFAGMRVLRQETLDGMKFYLENPEAGNLPRPQRPGCCCVPPAPSRCCAYTPRAALRNRFMLCLRRGEILLWETQHEGKNQGPAV